MANPSSFNQMIITEFRKNGGVLTGRDGKENRTLLLLTTTGAKSGQPRTSPLAFTRDGERLLIIASNQGKPTHPAWYHNLLANPVVTIELGAEHFQARARDTTGEEHDRLYAQMAKELPGFAKYQSDTHRTIPLLVLERIS
ncbi:MAG TPA: nitroreductase/quinone reductase family protein [Ktedonobacterales bacterium]